MLSGLAGAGQADDLGAEFASQSGGQVLLHLLPLGLLNVILGRVLQVSLNLRGRQSGEAWIRSSYLATHIFLCIQQILIVAGGTVDTDCI